MTALPAAQARHSDTDSLGFVPAFPLESADTYGPAQTTEKTQNAAAIGRWRSIRADLIDHCKTLPPRSKARLICEVRLRDATTALMALEAMK